ncbi:GNAT family N-acetyltransferase [Bacillus pseudomycoides]|uniref:GNAT family N-acetyltransferase n=1 Tax=Bacillus pseudomycoides TaxID=64104 RepID=UPI000BEB76F3|nr:GNAT family N-acetyltransferase [Bacillus pseudomycoides]MEB3054635.1 GNAT family N-acetyltransferase [Bacillus pseudomycoides]PDX97963.1 GNAT family N-acetyltransferase [Bacillus pseudomycoides]PEK74678.1 GNAT family N-acetyltransferase [Bacillus pseudomycoides]PEN10419.1 GNAT family N-acetyltransferase [Bacillus pseudomycoides]PGB91831.1 GNAT family N-acetyltransferase [Bacillus pseudomycoides]
MTYVVREMNVEDITAVQEVAKIAWHDTYKGIIPQEIQDKFLKQAYSNEIMKRRLEHSYLLVAEVEDQIVGFANFSPVKHQNEAELGAIYLLPDHQGKGIGTALLQRGIAVLDGAKKIYICVEAENEKGKQFYTAKGFAALEQFEEDFEGHMVQTVRMVLHV